MVTVEPGTLRFIYAAACHVAGVLAFVYTVALLGAHVLRGSNR